MRFAGLRAWRATLVSAFLVVLFLLLSRALAQVPGGKADGVPAAEPTPGIPASAAVLIVNPPGLAVGVSGGRPTAATAAPADVEKLYQRRILTHAAGLKSEHTIRQVLASPQAETRKTQWFRESADPLERSAWLRDHLRVTALPGTALIQVDLPDVRDATERRTILYELCQTYLDRNKRAQTDALLDRTNAMNTVRIKAEARLRDLNQEMRQKQIQLNVDGGGIGRMGVKEMELSKLVAEQVEASLRFTRARAAAEALASAAQKGEPMPGVDAVVEADARVQELTRRMEDARLRADLARAKPGGADKAVADDADAEARVLAAHVEARRTAVAARTKANLLEQARVAQAETTGVLEHLAKRIDNLKDAIGELSNMTVQYSNLQAEQKGLREQLENIKEQIGEIMAVSSTAMFSEVHWHQMPEAGLPTP